MTGSDAQPELPADIAVTLAQVLRDRGGLGSVNAVPLRRLVDDHCDKFVALDRNDRPVAFVVLSPPDYPQVVAHACERALSARDALGPTLGAAVLAPIHVGVSNGASFSITAYCEPFALNRLARRWQRWRMTPAILDWLSAAVHCTATVAGSAQREQLFARPLRSLAEHRSVDAAVRAAAARAAADLASGAWVPKTALAHNDFWFGNLLRREGTRAPSFFVIDWAGSLTEGHAIYDLVRMSISLNLEPARVRPTLASHCSALGCDVTQADHYLASALGHLCENLGQWPVEQFAQAAESCRRYLSRFSAG